MKPELDYAFLAQFASVENDRLTAVGASFTRLVAASVPAVVPFSLAARIRSSKDADDFPVQVRMISPAEEFDIGIDFMVSPSDAKYPYGDDERVGILLALNLNVPLPSHGLYTVRLSVDGAEVRDLKFRLLAEE